MDNSHDENSSESSAQESTGSNQVQEELALVEIQDEAALTEIQPTEADNDDVEEVIDAEDGAKDKEDQENENAGGANQPAVKQSQFALSRIKTIMKLDPDLSLTSKESVLLIAKATELFVEHLSREAYKFTAQGSRKTVQKKDIDQAINAKDELCFLDAALD